MLRRFTKKRAAVALSAIAALALAAGAYAYFSSTGSGTSQASVGSSTPYTVSVSPATGGPLYPGAGTENLAYTVKNPGTATQNLAATSVSVAHDATGNILDHGAAVSGCSASWFNVTDNHPAYGEIAGGVTKSGSVDVTMSDVNASQDSCQTHAPDITVNAS